MLFVTKCIQRLITIIYASSLVAGCTLTNQTYDTNRDNLPRSATPNIIMPTVSEPDPLSGTVWELVSITNQGNVIAVPKDLESLIQFNKGGLRFYMGCNDINGYYELNDDHNIIITFSEITAMDCTDRLGSEVMEVEDLFYQAMQTFESYAFQDDQLWIYYAYGELLFHKSLD